MRPVTFVGQQFGRWTVVRPSKYKDKVAWTLVCCECGTEREVRTGSLRNGSSKSCGCLSAELTRKRETTHGASRERLHNIWKGMLKRCHNPKAKAYSQYGAKGITACKSWHKYATFRKWAIANGYQDDLTIDRRDNEKGYYGRNCRWVTRKHQNCNRRTYSKSGFKGVTEAPSGRWKAVITANKKKIYLGTFDTALEAAKAYNKAAIEYHGEFACLNQF